MRRRDLIPGLDMALNSQSYAHYPEPCNAPNFVLPDIPPVNAVPNFEAHPVQENSSMFYRHPEYHHQHASNYGGGMPTAPNFYLPPPPPHPPPSHLLAPGSHEHERSAHFMDHGYKRKSAEVIPGTFQYPSPAAAQAPAPSSFLQFNTPEATPFSFPQHDTYPQGPQPLDQRSVRNTAGAATMDPPLSHGQNNFTQGNYAAHPFPPPPPIWYDQHCNGNRSDGSSSLWSQAPPVPYMHGNVGTGSIDSGNASFPRYPETSSSRGPAPFVYPRHNYISYHPPPPPPATVYPHMAPPSYTFPETVHDAAYSHLGPVLSTGFRIHQQHPRDDFIPAAALRHHGMHHLRGIPSYEVAVLEEGDLYGDFNYIDHHEDMRLDIEDMSYEELLALSDHIGTVKTGLSEEDVIYLLKRRTSILTRINLEEPPSTDPETDFCTICQEDYKNRDKIATLDCRHEYHAECLKKWLVIKNVCPICKTEALVMEKKVR